MVVEGSRIKLSTGRQSRAPPHHPQETTAAFDAADHADVLRDPDGCDRVIEGQVPLEGVRGGMIQAVKPGAGDFAARRDGLDLALAGLARRVFGFLRDGFMIGVR